MRNFILFFLILPITFLPGVVFAGQVEIKNVDVTKDKDHYRFDVTLEHADSGWEHYADRWEIISSTGEVLATRVLAHPHVKEQPFTRSVSTTNIPAGTNTVSIRAHDSVHGYNKKLFKLEIPK